VTLARGPSKSRLRRDTISVSKLSYRTRQLYSSTFPPLTEPLRNAAKNSYPPRLNCEKITSTKIDKMDYSYLNHHHQVATAGGGFDPSSCAMPGADGSVLATCNLAGAGPYGDLAARCGPAGPMGPSPQHAAAAAAYGAYGAMRGHHQYSAAPPPPPPMSTGSCSMIPRPRDHLQTPTMFATGERKYGTLSLLPCYVCSSCLRKMIMINQSKFCIQRMHACPPLSVALNFPPFAHSKQ